MKILSKLSKLYDFQIPSLCGNRIPWCVAVKQEEDEVLVADTKNPDQEPLHFTKDEWIAFTKGVKNNEFDYQEQ